LEKKTNSEKVNGRIIIDALAYARFNPNAWVELEPLDGVSLKSPLHVSDQKHRKSYEPNCDLSGNTGIGIPPHPARTNDVKVT
jgi:hypothetical protein